MNKVIMVSLFGLVFSSSCAYGMKKSDDEIELKTKRSKSIQKIQKKHRSISGSMLQANKNDLQKSYRNDLQSKRKSKSMSDLEIKNEFKKIENNQNNASQFNIRGSGLFNKNKTISKQSQVEIHNDLGLEQLSPQVLQDLKGLEDGNIQSIHVQPSAVSAYLKRNLIHAPIDKEITLTLALETLKDKDPKRYNKILQSILEVGQSSQQLLSSSSGNLNSGNLKQESKRHILVESDTSQDSSPEKIQRKHKKRKKIFVSDESSESFNSQASLELEETKLFLELMKVMKEKFEDDLADSEKQTKNQKIALWLTGLGMFAGFGSTVAAFIALA